MHCRRHFRLKTGLAVVLLSTTAALCPLLNRDPADNLDTLSVPPGFQVTLFATDLDGARSMALAPGGTLFVGTRSEGRVYALRDTDGDNVADVRYVVARSLDNPNGIAFLDGALYVGTVDRILRFDDIEANLASPPIPVVVSDRFTDKGGHNWKYMGFGPDGFLYVAVGAPCNICLENDPAFASIVRMRPDGSEFEIFAEGIRNSVGFDWHPETGELWFTDNGADWLGDNQPPDELNRAPEAGLHFGYPYCHGGTLQDGTVDSRTCDEFVAPEVALGPHVAALGMRFYTGDMFPAEYRGRIFIAEHGSWNRSDPIGYRVMQIVFDAAGNPVGYEPFVEGWLQGNSAWGRPVDILQMPDGSLLVSDDRADAIYRISYAPSP
jgi:glucose/arabinose dehydrogenase